MKKQTVKNLSLNKKAVSKLQVENVSGGFEPDETVTQTFVWPLPICNCPAPSRFRDIRSLCLCL
ncbi:MAG: class I lanthipeptide [Bacteroidota bacterium]